MRSICRRGFSTSSLRPKAGAALAQVPRRQEEIDEKIRDPPPPANFPGLCPPNNSLRQHISRLDREVFEKNGLHNIPYRDATTPDEPIPVYDGTSWPDADATNEPLIDIRDDEVIDIFARRSEEAVVAEETRVRYRDIPHNALTKLIAAIKYPVEMRLLPHIVREWHRQGFPITLTDAQRIARLATRHDEVDVVLQMVRPETFGLYYDMEGLREISRGLAKRVASTSQREQGQKELRPEDMLRLVPELLHCAVGADANRLLKDPAVLGTQLWGFMARFNNDESFRTIKSVLEMCGLADRVSESIENYNFGPSLRSERPISENLQRDVAFDIKYQVLDFIPALYALRQFVQIISAPYKACLKAFQNADISDIETQQTITDLRRFLGSRISIPLSTSPNTGNATATATGERYRLKWISLNRRLGSEIKRNAIKLPELSDWQWSLLKQYTAPAPSSKTTAAILQSGSDSLQVPLRAQAALRELEKRMQEWEHVLEKEGIPVKSEFKIKVVRYGS